MEKSNFFTIKFYKHKKAFKNILVKKSNLFAYLQNSWAQDLSSLNIISKQFISLKIIDIRFMKFKNI